MKAKGKSIPVVSDRERRRLVEAQQRAWQAVEQVQQRNADADPDQVLEDVTAEVEAVRQERYERRRLSTKNGR